MTLKPSDIKRFQKYVDTTPGQGPKGTCWQWTGSTKPTGHGQFSLNGRPVGAHQTAFFLKHGRLSPVTRHACDNPPCVRPAHLRGGTHQDNVNDRQRRGRTRTGHLYGEQHPNHRLTLAEVRSIKEQLARGTTIVALGKQFGVDHTTISRIKCGRTWVAA